MLENRAQSTERRIKTEREIEKPYRRCDRDAIKKNSREKKIAPNKWKKRSSRQVFCVLVYGIMTMVRKIPMEKRRKIFLIWTEINADSSAILWFYVRLYCIRRLYMSIYKWQKISYIRFLVFYLLLFLLLLLLLVLVELLLSTFGPKKKNDRIRFRIIIALNVLYSKLE